MTPIFAISARGRLAVTGGRQVLLYELSTGERADRGASPRAPAEAIYALDAEHIISAPVKDGRDTSYADVWSTTRGHIGSLVIARLHALYEDKLAQWIERYDSTPRCSLTPVLELIHAQQTQEVESGCQCFHRLCINPSGKLFSLSTVYVGRTQQTKLGEHDPHSGELIGTIATLTSADKASKTLLCNERYAIITSQKAQLFVIDLSSGERHGLIQGFKRSLRQLTLSPDGSSLCAIDEESTLQCWSLAALTSRWRVKRLRFDPNHVHHLAVHPSGERLFGLAGDNTLIIWRLSDGAELARYSLPRGASALCFNQDAALYALGRDTQLYHIPLT
jgi:hypothetical protein